MAHRDLNLVTEPDREGALERSGPGFGDGLVLIARTATDADGTHDHAVAHERHASGEDRHPAVIGGVDAEELLRRLRVLAEILGRDVEGPGRPRLADRD